MFWVSDSREVRKQKIEQLLENEPALALLLAVFDVEWCIRRAIIALGKTPNRELREHGLKNCHGLAAYKELWRCEVAIPRNIVGLSATMPDWNKLKAAFLLRHKLVHGVEGTTGGRYAFERTCWALESSEEIRDFCLAHGVDLHRRLPVRKTFR